jgi:putative membrane protein
MGTISTTRRFPRRVFDSGTEPDPRFTLANERTFLAWIRTSLALIAAGVAIEALALPLPPTVRLATAVTLIGLGLVVPPLAWRSWGLVERAMRRASPLPTSLVAPVLAIGIAAVAALLAIGFLVR